MLSGEQTALGCLPELNLLLSLGVLVLPGLGYQTVHLVLRLSEPHLLQGLTVQEGLGVECDRELLSKDLNSSWLA